MKSVKEESDSLKTLSPETLSISEKSKINYVRSGRVIMEQHTLIFLN